MAPFRTTVVSVCAALYCGAISYSNGTAVVSVRGEMEKDRDFQSPKKRRKVDLPVEKRFASAVSDGDMAVMSKGYVPPNTKKNTDWALSCFREWRCARKSAEGDQQRCPEDILEKPEVSQVNFSISRFVAEVRNKRGEPYPPKSIHQLLAGLQRYMLDKNPGAPKFLDKQETCFREIRGTCDTVYRDLRSKGVGAEVHHTHFHRRRGSKAVAVRDLDHQESQRFAEGCVLLHWEVLLHSWRTRTEEPWSIKFQMACRTRL